MASLYVGEVAWPANTGACLNPFKSQVMRRDPIRSRATNDQGDSSIWESVGLPHTVLAIRSV